MSGMLSAERQRRIETRARPDRHTGARSANGSGAGVAPISTSPVGRAEDFPYAVMQHSTPMLRQLQGLPMQLQHNKITSPRLAVAPLDGRVLRPGQRLSFWKCVGNPSAKRGYLDGVVLDDGVRRAGVGGGLCQLTNLLYWMTLHTPLTVVERWRHTYDVFPDNARTQPFGLARGRCH